MARSKGGNKSSKIPPVKKVFPDSVGIAEPDKSKIVIDFSFPNCFYHGNCDYFTNMFKDEKQYIEYHVKLFRKVIPHLSQYTADEIYMQKHCHTISRDDDRKLILKIIESIGRGKRGFKKDDVTQLMGDEKIFQIGFEGIRLIGYMKYDHHFKVLLIDYHHLLFPNCNYNAKDHNSYSYDPFKEEC